ncbi:MAG: hypothetical protein WC122_01955 [archaeon]
MDDKDIIEAAFKGTAAASLDKGVDYIKKLATTFSNGDLAFIEDYETIDIIKKNKKRPALIIYKKYITNSNLIKPIEMGFTLIDLERTESHEKISNLKQKILLKYKEKGLHIAELVQCGMFHRYFALLEQKSESDALIKSRVEDLLNDIEKYTLFVKQWEKEEDSTIKALNKINTFDLKTFLIFSKGDCRDKATKIVENIMKSLNDFYNERQLDNELKNQFDFILKNGLEGTSLFE